MSLADDQLLVDLADLMWTLRTHLKERRIGRSFEDALYELRTGRRLNYDANDRPTNKLTPAEEDDAVERRRREFGRVIAGRGESLQPFTYAGASRQISTMDDQAYRSELAVIGYFTLGELKRIGARAGKRNRVMSRDHDNILLIRDAGARSAWADTIHKLGTAQAFVRRAEFQKHQDRAVEALEGLIILLKNSVTTVRPVLYANSASIAAGAVK